MKMFITILFNNISFFLEQNLPILGIQFNIDSFAQNPGGGGASRTPVPSLCRRYPPGPKYTCIVERRWKVYINLSRF